MKVAVIGIGLIGGSAALQLSKSGFATKIIGVDNNEEHKRLAIEKGIVHQCLSLTEAVEEAEVIIIATPVDSAIDILSAVLDQIDESKVVVDMCSTKMSICKAVEGHSSRGRFVAIHPMAGTEFSGPLAAKDNLFLEQIAIICEKDRSDKDALQISEQLLRALYMRLDYMDSEEHDKHAAYVSHISHVSSFALALAVMDKERNQGQEIQRMAAGGFRSTVRLAKSSPTTWKETLIDNSDYVVEAIDSYLSEMEKLRDCIKNENKSGLEQLIAESNQIGEIIDKIESRTR